MFNSMLKRACTFGILAAATVVSFSSVARADSLTNVQTSTQEAAAVGNFNSINQHTEQYNVQRQQNGSLPISGAPNEAISVQDAKQAGGIVGHGNILNQTTEQINSQQQISRPSIILPVVP